MEVLRRLILVGGVGAWMALAPHARAQDCSAAPLFDMSGQTCSPERQGKECGCSECFDWDPAPGATWYEIRRCDGDGIECAIVGNTRHRNRPGVRPTLWCVAWDDPFPVLGTIYQYSVRSCADGASGPRCSPQLSAPVGYLAAPYLCIDNGLEVPCQSLSGIPSETSTDADDDGVTSSIDADDDGDRVPDILDNCPQMTNVGQRDADGDGVGDACDFAPKVPGVGPADADRDGIGDRMDVCPWSYDPLQSDVDRDRTGDACDNCPSDANDTQTDADEDGQGDRCDVDDGRIDVVFSSVSRLTWAPELGYSTWCAYRGDLAELRRSGTYTQLPGSLPNAERLCGLASPSAPDNAVPAPGTAAFLLVSGRPGSSSLELGVDSSGAPRPNTNPCP